MTISIGTGRWTFGLDEARAAVAGYAFATRRIGDEDAPRWAYRTYDCIPASPGAAFSDLDIFVAVGINAQLNASAVAGLQLAARRAAGDLADAAARGTEFADLPMEQLKRDPPQGSTGWLLTRAYQQFEGTPYVALARAHKVLHHKYPLLVPLIDRVTDGAYRHGQRSRLRDRWTLWQHVRHEIEENRVEFEELCQWFATQATARGGVVLGLPRLHDVLLWLHAVKGDQWATAVAEGSRL